MAPFQVFFIRGVKNSTSGLSREEFAAIEAYLKDPTGGVLIFVADSREHPLTPAAWT